MINVLVVLLHDRSDMTNENVIVMTIREMLMVSMHGWGDSNTTPVVIPITHATAIPTIGMKESCPPLDGTRLSFKSVFRTESSTEIFRKHSVLACSWVSHRIHEEAPDISRGQKETDPPTAKVERSVKIRMASEASVALREAPDDHKEGNDAGKAVAADFIDECDQVLGDRREVPTLLRAEDDVHHHTKCDQDQREIHNVFRPVLDSLNRIHVFFSGQVINANPPNGVGVLCSIRAARSTPSTSTCLRAIGRTVRFR